MSRQIGIVKMNYGALASAMHLPEGHRIVGLRLPDSFTDTFEIAVEGPSLLEVAADQVIPIVNYVITVTEDREQLVPARTFTGQFMEKRG